MNEAIRCVTPTDEWGYYEIILADYLKKNNISKSKLCRKAELQHTQLNTYCKNKIQRPDLGVLVRICFALKCDIGDIIKYVPPNK